MKCLTLIFCFFAASVGCAQVSFSPFIEIPTGSWPEVVCIGDVNNDGRNDIVMGMASYASSANDYTILVFKQDAAGNLGTPVKYPYLSGSSEIECMDIADMNNDGLQDIVIGYGTKIGIFYQNSEGTLNTISEIPVTSLVKSLKVGDLNNDGINDIGIAYYGSNIATLIQSETGTFAHSLRFCTTAYDTEIHIGDMNGDGKNDVVVKSFDAVHVLLQNTFGTLDQPVTYGSGDSSWINGIATGDLDNDGKDDIVASKGGNSPSSKIVIWKQDPGTQLFSNPSLLSAYDIPEPIEVADLNNDGRNEIITAHGGWMSLSCYEQGLSGQYGPYYDYPLPYASHYNRQGLALGDFNNDGLKDVAIADYNHGLVMLYNISESLSTQGPQQMSEPVVFPNPVVDVLHIDFSNAVTSGETRITIFNGLGAQMKMVLKSTESERLDMSNFASGIYYLKIEDSDSSITKKIIKR
ncbi:MAG: hypothetical protein CFE23_15670 [Flavobacterium sp. BFFFF1]|uniref:T9SS type A sorting domain-containing protein n=1 Tax=Flavobacterium sp. BFFFF1 TaxID=2015557 RepID=UPI000BD428D1|nr:T9SS type A sorting domain-containing protein [Flavobacterium sp. BFFFF1]OYU79096.1 MAG: hypothetical protein CFE23_15670 [Flavobacterium sp. BFFFF1]